MRKILRPWVFLPAVLWLKHLDHFRPSMDCRVLSFVLAAYLTVLLCVRQTGARAKALAWIDRFETRPPPERGGKGALWLVVGLVLTGLGYLTLRSLTPNYFLFDDNHGETAPVVTRAVADFLATGRFPTWNPYQLLGAPFFEVGIYGLSYPPTYLAAWLTKDAERLWDVFFLLHVFPGFALTWLFLSRLGIHPLLRLLASLSFVYCGYFVVAGASWNHMIPFLVWIPLAGLSLAGLGDFRTGKWKALTVLALAGGFWSGNAQMAFYLWLFWGIGVGLLLLRMDKPERSASWRPLAGTLAIALGLVTLLIGPQFLFLLGGVRNVQFQGGITPSLRALFLPAPLVNAGHPNDWPWLAEGQNGQLLFAGGLLTIAALAATALALARLVLGETKQKARSEDLWIWLGALALVLAMGREGMLSPLLAALPVIRGFTHMFKFLPFLHFFWLTAGAVLLDRAFRRHGKTVAALTLVGVLLVFHHLRQCVHNPELAADYRPLPPEFSFLDTDEVRRLRLRVDTDNPDPFRYWPGRTWALDQNFATQYRIATVSGYDPQIWAQLRDVELRERWKLDPATMEREWGVRYKFTVTGSQVTTTQLPEPKPIAHFTERPERELPIEPHFNGVEIANPGGEGGSVTLAFLWRPNLHARLDGTETKVNEDALGRVQIQTPAGWKRLSLSYIPRWKEPFLLALLLCLGGWVLLPRGVKPNHLG